MRPPTVEVDDADEQAEQINTADEHAFDDAEERNESGGRDRR